MEKYCVIGSPIEHSLSPKMHNYWFAKYNIKAQYLKENISPEELSTKIIDLKGSYTGFNITYPLKNKIIPYIDHIDPLARTIGSVNTVKNTNGRWEGYNTDVVAMTKILKKNASDQYFILGSGNMAKTTLHALGNKRATIVCRNLEKGREISLEGERTSIITFPEFAKMELQKKVIINTLPLDVDVQQHLIGKKDNIFIDSNYNISKDYGISTYISGLELLILQGIESFFIWTNIRPSKESAYEALGL